MKLSELKQLLPNLTNVAFQLENKTYVPEHFHVTEVGLVTKNFIDCGGVLRQETVVNFQLWNADDYEHKLKPAKLLHIINLAEQKLGITDLEIEVEYQTTTVGKYTLGFNGNHFILVNKKTACLAQEACGIPQVKQMVNVNVLETSDENCCAPGGGCC